MSLRKSCPRQVPKSRKTGGWGEEKVRLEEALLRSGRMCV